MREDYVSAVGGFEGRFVRTGAEGLLGHVTVSIPSLRVALTSDSYISKKKHRVSPLLNGKEEEMWVENWEMKMKWKPYPETIWNPNGTTEGSKTQLLYRGSQRRRLITILRCILR